MTFTLARFTKRCPAVFMLALALVYLLHAASHSALGEVPIPPSGAAVALALDPFVYAESQSGDGVAGCHFFCNHGCPVPPLPHPPRLAEVPQDCTYATTLVARASSVHRQPLEAPPRFLA